MFSFLVAATALVATHASAQSTQAVKASNAGTSLTFIYQNNLNATDDVNHRGAILLDPITAAEGKAACAALGETLLPASTINSHKADFVNSLAYLEFADLAKDGQQFYILNGVVTVTESPAALKVSKNNQGTGGLPVLCSQSSNQNGASNAQASSANQITIKSTGGTYVGFRNQKSFRFVGIPYAN